MRLLLDNNLSWRTLGLLDSRYADSQSVQQLGMMQTPDVLIWRYAIKHGFAVVTKDDDFLEMSLQRGHPPRVILLTVGNTPATVVGSVLNRAVDAVLAFNDDAAASLLILP